METPSRRAYLRTQAPDEALPAISRRDFATRAGGLVIGTSMLASLLAACGGGDDGAADAGSSAAAGASSASAGGSSAAVGSIGGTLNLHAYPGYDNKEPAEAWGAKNGVTFKVGPAESPEEIFTTLKAGTPKYDAVSTLVFQGTQLAAADLLLPLDLSRLPNAADFLPPVKDALEQAKIDGQTFVVPLAWGINVPVFNADKIATPPTKWMDFTGDEYKDKLGLSDSPLDNFNAWGFALGYEPPNMTKKELDEVTKFLIDFKKSHVRTFGINYDDFADQLSRGDIVAVASPIWANLALQAQDKGGTGTTFAIFDEPGGGLIWIDGWCIPKTAENVDTAYAFIDEQLSAESQAKMCPAMTVATVNAKAVDMLPASERERDAVLYSGTLGVKPLAYPSGEATYEDYVQAWAQVQAA